MFTLAYTRKGALLGTKNISIGAYFYWQWIASGIHAINAIVYVKKIILMIVNYIIYGTIPFHEHF